MFSTALQQPLRMPNYSTQNMEVPARMFQNDNSIVTNLVNNSRVGSTTENNTNQLLSHYSAKFVQKHCVNRNIFDKPAIIESILCNLPNPDLLNCRLVNFEWNYFTNKELQTREQRLAFYFSTFSMTYTTYPQGMQLRDLTDFLTSTTNTGATFPVSHFDLTGGSLTNYEVQRFLEIFGRNIEGLTISFTGSQLPGERPPTLYDLRKLFTEQLPNIRYLQIHNLTSFNYENGYLSQGGLNRNTLLKLRSFCFRTFGDPLSTTFLEDFLELCPYLRSLQWDDDRRADDIYLNFLLDIKKSYLVRKLDLNKFQYIPDTILNFVAKSDPHIESLVLPCFKHKNDFGPIVTITNLTNTILKQCSKHLRCLELCSVGFLRGLVIPILPKLELLLPHGASTSDVNGNTEKSSNLAFFPRDLVLSRTFPKLQSIRLIFENRPNTNVFRWRDYFNRSAKHDILPSVKQLDFGFCPPIAWLRYFVRMFPNVEDVFLGNVQNFSGVMQTLYNLNSLRKLELVVDVQSVGNQYPAIDTALTGFSKEESNAIFQTCYPEDVEFIHKCVPRQNRSILDLPALRFLAITLENNEQGRNGQNQNFAESVPPIMTHVSAFFAFQMCPHIRVDIQWFHMERERISALCEEASKRFPFVYQNGLPFGIFWRTA